MQEGMGSDVPWGGVEGSVQGEGLMTRVDEGGLEEKVGSGMSCLAPWWLSPGAAGSKAA